VLEWWERGVLRNCCGHGFSGTFKDRRLSELIGKTFAYAYATVQDYRLFVFVIDMLFRDEGAGGDRANGQGEVVL
jgi:hypothetical protein